ncbi:MAG: thiamine-binding protein [Bacillota bacterium]|nr:thiamine-binding protein [Bacillota bacterium]
MAKVNMSLQVLPAVVEAEIYPIVDKVIEMIDASGLRYVVGPFETSIEGELDELFEIVKKAQNICTKLGVDRVVSIVKIDYRKEGVTIDEKISKYR